MFLSRVLGGAIVLAIMSFGFYKGGLVLGTICMIISTIAFKELTHACGVESEDKKLNGVEIFGIAGIIVYYAVMLCSSNFGAGSNLLLLLLTIVGTFIAELFVYVCSFPKFDSNQIMGAIFAFLYAPVMLSFIYLTRESTSGALVIWLVLINSWGCDTFAYLIGMLTAKTIGNHKAFPKLSPKKSIEGCAAGVVGTSICGAVYAHFVLRAEFPNVNIELIFAIISAIAAVMSMAGDLAASAIKRNHNIKDYGHLIPGHGGIMDRFDSVIVTAPITYLMLYLFLNLK